MKAIVYHEFGTPDQLKLEEVEKPSPKSEEILVKVKAASINSWDWDLLIGTSLTKLINMSFSKPKLKILGCDISGIVEELGSEVTDFKIGDEIFGDISGANWGGFAEYVCAPAKLLAKKPKEITFEEAAAAPQAGVLALQGLMYKDKPKKNQKVLLIGAGGGVGIFALQMAKEYDLEVTCVDKSCKLKHLKSLGADYILDYEQNDISNLDDKYDIILDPIMKRSLFDYRKLLLPNGKFGVIGGETSKLLQTLFIGSSLSLFTNKKMGVVMHIPNKNDLETVGEFISSKKITKFIDKIYPLEQTAEAFKYYSEGNFIGKIIITI